MPGPREALPEIKTFQSGFAPNEYLARRILFTDPASRTNL